MNMNVINTPVLLQSNAKSLKEHIIKINQIIPVKPLRQTDAKNLREHLYRLHTTRKYYDWNNNLFKEKSLFDKFTDKFIEFMNNYF